MGVTVQGKQVLGFCAGALAISFALVAVPQHFEATKIENVEIAKSVKDGAMTGTVWALSFALISGGFYISANRQRGRERDTTKSPKIQ